MEKIKSWAPYIGIVIGLATLFILYRQHIRQEKEAAVGMELDRLQLELLRKQNGYT